MPTVDVHKQINQNMEIKRKKLAREVNNVNCMAKFELVLDESPMEKSGNHELPGVSCDPEPEPDPEPADVVPVFIGIVDESLEDFRLQKQNRFRKTPSNVTSKCIVYTLKSFREKLDCNCTSLFLHT